MNRKGQYFSVEQMLLFSIGLIITISIYFALVSVNENVKEMVIEDQMGEIATLINSEINRMYVSSENSELKIQIPKKISESGYRIYVEGSPLNKLVLKLEEEIVKIPINEELNASGMLFSSSGQINIKKSQGRITIGRF